MSKQRSRKRKTRAQEIMTEEETLEPRKRRKQKRKEKNKKRKKFKLILRLIILIIIVICAVKLGISTNRWQKLAHDMLINESSIVIDTKGVTIAELGGEKKKEPIKFSQMPEILPKAYVAIEDERFYKHHGVDLKRTTAAIGSYIIHFGSSSYGGSTITQQLVKNLTGDSTDSISRKVKEWWKAFTLETTLSKDEVLEAYLNIIYVGPNVYGVEAGSKYYFNKSINDLSLEEIAFLAGINHSPNSYNPFEEKDNSEKIKKRTKIVLSKMLELKYISQEDYDTAVSNVDDGLKFAKGNSQTKSNIYSYHTDALITEVTKDISKEYNISEAFASNYLYMSGLTIYSNQDSEIQNKIESEFKKNQYMLASKNGGDSSQAAMVIIDQRTGYVTGCVGGLGEKTEARTLNRATQSIRQTGSSIKPLSVLVPAISKRIITASSIYDDSERDFVNNYHPTDLTKSLGEITVRRAVESSQNIPFVEIMEQIKPSRAIRYLKKMGITTLTEKDNDLVLSLGGLEKGISPLQMAGAYATIANDGIYIEPTFYNKIEKKDRTTFLVSKQNKRKVFSADVAYIVKDLLKEPVRGEYGTATYCSISGMDVAAKTGTTDENYDRWLCGFTPYYTAVTWFGYDQNETIEYNGNNPAGVIWSAVMRNVHTNLKSASFIKPATIKTVTVCSKTGLRANPGCPDTYEENFLNFTIPGKCTSHGGAYKPSITTTQKNTTTNTNTNTENTNVNTNITNTNTTTTNNVNNTQNTFVTNTTNSTNSTATNTNNKNNTSNITTNNTSNTTNSSGSKTSENKATQNTNSTLNSTNTN